MSRQKIAVLGAGTIGASWTALFAASGKEVVVFDPSPDAVARVLSMIESAAEALAALGYSTSGDASRVAFTDDPVIAVRNAEFVQENVPETLGIKHDLYARIEVELADDAIVAASTSGLTLTELQAGFRDPSHLILAHPFNPPHLIPLVEVMGNAATFPGLLDRAVTWYESLGKVCVRLNREVSGHVANRLQAAIWREAIHLVTTGVISVADVDRAIAFGPGLRWAEFGPNTLFHLGGGEAGLRGFCDHLGPAFESWWDDLGSPRLSPDVVERLVEGMDEAIEGRSPSDLTHLRDRLILAHLRSRADVAEGN